MRGIFLIFLVVILPIIVLSHRECKIREFLEFRYAYNKTYANATDEYHRCEVFSENFEMIERHNRLFKASKTTFKKAINGFADFTSAEFIKTFTGIPQQPVQDSSPRSSEKHRRVKRSGTTATTVPASWVAGNLDLRTSAIPVKDQGGCGSCWAFSATGVFEYRLLKTYGNYYDLSEQNSVDCARASGCSGGWMSEAFDYYLSKGVDFENVYPYKAAVGACNYVANKTGRGFSSAYSQQWYSIPGDERLMAYLIQQKGWISVCINANALQLYKSGIIPASSCSRGPNHAVILVGYGYDTTTKLYYWIGRNTWSSGWGESGYFRLQRGANACDIANPYQGYRVHLA